MSHCSVCGCASGKTHIAREMMFGTREEFTYFECSACGCLQLATIPPDLAPYYDRAYYSFQQVQAPPGWKRFLRTHSTRAELLRVPGAEIVRRVLPRRFEALAALACARPSYKTRMLDVGCGSGALVYVLREAGFTAEGIDPYLPHDFTDKYGIRVHRAGLDEVVGKWDLIIFNHSLEHMPNHGRILRLVRERLTPKGRCLVRMPVAHDAWKIYGVNWVQLDAPRHLFLHTAVSFRRLSEENGFSVESFHCDSSRFQFWGSELYARGIPLREGNEGMFSNSELQRFERRAKELNRSQLGDQAVFLLRPNDAWTLNLVNLENGADGSQQQDRAY